MAKIGAKCEQNYRIDCCAKRWQHKKCKAINELTSVLDKKIRGSDFEKQINAIKGIRNKICYNNRLKNPHDCFVCIVSVLFGVMSCRAVWFRSFAQNAHDTVIQE